jgi:hypothetical protein
MLENYLEEKVENIKHFSGPYKNVNNKTAIKRSRLKRDWS